MRWNAGTTATRPGKTQRASVQIILFDLQVLAEYRLHTDALDQTDAARVAASTATSPSKMPLLEPCSPTNAGNDETTLQTDVA